MLAMYQIAVLVPAFALVSKEVVAVPCGAFECGGHLHCPVPNLG
jgi:hypothetical protein